MLKRSLRNPARIIGLFALAGVFLSAFSVSAEAIELDPAYFFEQVSAAGYSDTGTDNSLAESVSVVIPPEYGRGTGSASAWASAFYPVSTGAEVNLAGKDSPAAFGGSASVQIKFQFAVEPLGGGLSDLVPIIISASGFVTVDTEGGTTGDQKGRVMIDIPGARWEATNVDEYGTWHDGTFSFDEDLYTDVAANTAYDITMNLQLHGQGAGLGFLYDAKAFMDPTIVIDPTFLDWDQYKVVFSDGITTVVPEPASLALLGSGLAILGWQRARRKRKAGVKRPLM